MILSNFNVRGTQFLLLLTRPVVDGHVAQDTLVVDDVGTTVENRIWAHELGMSYTIADCAPEAQMTSYRRQKPSSWRTPYASLISWSMSDNMGIFMGLRPPSLRSVLAQAWWLN